MEKFTIEMVEDKLRTGQVAPGELSLIMLWLGGDYSYHAGLIDQVLRSKPSIWNGLRPDYKSDTATERAWQQTSEGLLEQSLKLRLKRDEIMMRAVKARIGVLETEARNIT